MIRKPEPGLSEARKRADQRARIERLKAEARELSGGDMLCDGSEDDEHLDIVEQFWERVVAFERADKEDHPAPWEQAED